jgi:hypothetical protein
MATPRGKTYTAPSGATVYGGRGPAVPSWLASAAAYEMVAAPNGQPSTATGLVAADGASMGTQNGMVNAWGGAVADGAKFYIHGGGHADYYGNEIGAIDLSQESPAWDLLIERTPVASLLGGSNYYADGAPTSRHTYYAMAVAEVGGVKRLLRFNAWSGFAYNGPPVGGAADVRTLDVDGFNLATNQWEPGAYGPAATITGSGTGFAQDPTTGDCYAWPTNSAIQKYTLATDTCATVATLGGSEGDSGACAVDAVAGKLYRFAGRASARCSSWALTGGSKVSETFTGPAASVLNGLTGDNPGWGIAHDTLRNVVYLMTGAAVLYRVRLSDLYADQVSSTGATPAAPTNATWGRLKYLPDLDAIVYLASWTSPLLVMRCG